jgi:prepilin-type N-terminal cleavage/methylation domain-containing protein
MKNNKHHEREGFTLIELLVAIALFSILVAIATGGFVNALRSERQASSMMSAESNVDIALEEMTREMRTSYQFCHEAGSDGPDAACAPACLSLDYAHQPWTCSAIEYKNAAGDTVDYTLSQNGSQAGVLMRSETNVNGDKPQAVTASSTSIQYLTFILQGNIEGDHWNPRITIGIGVQPTDKTITWNTANLETTVSARPIDCIPGISSC